VFEDSGSNPKPVPRPGSFAASDLYDEGYFYGKNSGYPTEGYRVGRPDWTAWLEFIHLLRPRGVFVDLGCAYGYLVNEARQRGYRAFGLDVSRFALRQEANFRPWLLEASASRLPLGDHSADVVTVFDVLEHLTDPRNCLAEVRRVLKDDGLLVGATPDPVFFDRFEPTHVFERPPSFWLAILRELGFQVRFRFSGEAFNFQFVATPAPDAEAGNKLSVFQHDYFDRGVTDVIEVDEQSSGLVEAVLRSGWGSPGKPDRKLAGFPASVYLLNRSDQPLNLRLAIHLRHTPDFSTFRVRLNSYVIAEIQLDSEKVERTVQVEKVLLPSGGHHLFFDLFPGGPEITLQSIRIEARPDSHASLVAGLPFDLFQRYRLSSDISRVLAPKTLLDIGGYLGDENGHLGVTHDFFEGRDFPSPRITVTDVRQCDHPDYWKAAATSQPFADSSFDLAMSLDVLEHLPESERKAFLEELDRVSRHWILLGAPFASEEVEQAEVRLAESVMQARQFLQEHRELGLPSETFVRDFYVSRGYSVTSFPNGYLPSWLFWQVTTQHYFTLNDYDVTRGYNSLYPSVFFPFDNREPAYRHILLISKTAPDARVQAELAKLTSSPTPDRHPIEGLAFQPAFLEVHQRATDLGEKRQRALTDVQFLINERQKLVGLLRKELETPLWRQVWRRLRKRIGGEEIG